MQRLFTLFLALMTISLTSIAQGSTPETTKPIIMDIHTQDNCPNPKPHRAPSRIAVEAYFDSETNTIVVSNEGCSSGEVLLYCEGELIGYSSEINTTFVIEGSGFYTIEIHGEGWIAEGSIII